MNEYQVDSNEISLRITTSKAGYEDVVTEISLDKIILSQESGSLERVLVLREKDYGVSMPEGFKLN